MRKDTLLRQKAEEALMERQLEHVTIRSELDILRLVHELEVHQIELEMQNEELLLAKNQAELAAAKYVELYDFAPSGYFILSKEGEITQLNLAGSQMLGMDRSQLKNSRFEFLVSTDTRPIFKHFLDNVFINNAQETCDLSMFIPDSQPRQVCVTGFAETNDDECFITMVDITERKRIEKEIIHTNEELTFQNEEKDKRTAELAIANKELAFQNEENHNRAEELMDANRLIAFQRDRLEEIASLVPGLVFQYRLHPDGTSCCPFASDSINQLFRVTPKEVREDATKIFTNMHPDDQDGVIASIQKSAKELSQWQYEYRVKFDDGTIRNHLGNSLPRMEEDGSVLWHGFITDVTDLKRMERHIQERLKRLPVLYRLSHLADEKDISLDAFYQRAVDILPEGWQYPEITCARIVVDGNEFCTENFEDSLWKQSATINESGIGLIEVAYLVEKPEEDEGPFLIEERTFIDSAAALIKQIIKRKKAEMELEKVAARLALATSCSGIGVWDYDLAKDILVWNDQMYALYGIQKSDFSNDYQALQAGLHPEDFEQCATDIHKALHDEKEYDNEFRVIWPDGSVHHIKTFAIVQRDNFGKPLHVIGTNWDITAMKRTELEINRKNKELQKLNSEKDNFFSIIAHDLRGPLGGFMGLTELLTDESCDFTVDYRKELMAGLNRSSHNVYNLLENLLEWSHTSRGLTEFKPQNLNLLVVVTECLNIVAEPMRAKAIELVVDIPNELIVFADKNMLQTVIRNLISNAIKFTPNGGWVTILAKPAENQMTGIQVKDTGIGMSDEMRHTLFNIDAKNKRPGTNGEKSTGLGLLLCKEFVEKLGGKIGVESEQKQGSVFSFTIPSVGESPEKEINEPVVLDEGKKRQLNNLKILIAEDDEISAKLIYWIVKGFSRDIFQVKTGIEAVKLCLAHPDFDLVLMDIAMPEMDGYEATRQIRQFNADVLIIAQTTYLLANDRKKALEAGCNDFIAKPYSQYALVDIIKKHMVN